MNPVFNKGRYKSDSQVFRRWSRKGYAAFASMNKEIKISCINTSYNLLVPSTECSFSGFCYVPLNSRDKNETDELEALRFELMQVMVLQNQSTTKTSQTEPHQQTKKVLSTNSYSRNFRN
ncbi:hypothetical protein [Labilibaculum euxinus]|uniref:Uncharacterized protein n=1 Tax=Labilibaculum euxinus TaxID=2686357 RepID=A0A7M4D0N6_9BACT|nr:hypothetical protein [Labilibaculum euxinus]MUP36215.1 hypothetical protein [Labilibaculum euxinus]MVB05420.1 hypothetical protein [Labilibaculum euxinus]